MVLGLLVSLDAALEVISTRASMGSLVIDYASLGSKELTFMLLLKACLGIALDLASFVLDQGLITRINICLGLAFSSCESN